MSDSREKSTDVFNVGDYQSQKELLDAIAAKQNDPTTIKAAQDRLNKWVETGVDPEGPSSDAKTTEELLDALPEEAKVDYFNMQIEQSGIDVSEALEGVDQEALDEALRNAKSSAEVNAIMQEHGLVRNLR